MKYKTPISLVAVILVLPGCTGSSMMNAFDTSSTESICPAEEHTELDPSVYYENDTLNEILGKHGFPRECSHIYTEIV